MSKYLRRKSGGPIARIGGCVHHLRIGNRELWFPRWADGRIPSAMGFGFSWSGVAVVEGDFPQGCSAEDRAPYTILCVHAVLRDCGGGSGCAVKPRLGLSLPLPPLTPACKSPTIPSWHRRTTYFTTTLYPFISPYHRPISIPIPITQPTNRARQTTR